MTPASDQTDCYSCTQNAISAGNLPPRECVYEGEGWRIAHAFGSALPGWMVIVSHRHIKSLSELTAAEASALGPLIRRLSAALEAVTGARKCYIVFLAESQGFEHVHIHVIPRVADAPQERKGIGAMQYLAQPESEWVSHDEMDSISAAVAKFMRQPT